MRRRDLGLIGAALAVLGGGFYGLTHPPIWSEAPRTANESPSEPAPAAVPREAGGLLFPESIAELGSIQQTTVHAFACENRSAVPVTIGEVRASCGCVVARLEQRVIAPGERGKISVTLDPSRQAIGRHVQFVDVELLAPDRHLVRLEVRFHNRPDVVTPEWVDFRIVSGQVGSARFDLIDYRAQPLKITKVTTSSPHLQSAILTEPSNYLPGWRYQLNITLNAAAPLGDYQETVTLHTDDPGRIEISVPIRIRYAPRLRASPTAVHLKAAEDGSGTGRFFVSDSLGEPVEIELVKSSPDGLGCTVEPSTSASSRIVSLKHVDKPGVAAQLGKWSVRVVINRPVREELIIEVHPCAR